MSDEIMYQGPYPRGEYRDTLLGSMGQVLHRSPWRQNLIVDGLRRLLAALAMGDPQGVPLAYWAVGTGEEAWDGGTAPSEAARRTLTRLYRETARKPIPAGQIDFIGGAFTNRLEIDMEFVAADIPAGTDNRNWRLREFGLFAGGSGTADSGILINHRIHPRIDMQAGFTLQRTLHLTF